MVAIQHPRGVIRAIIMVVILAIIQVLLFNCCVSRKNVSEAITSFMAPTTGPWLDNHPNLISGVDAANGGRPIVLKLLLTHEAAMAQATAAELRAAHDLGLAKPAAPLVPLEVGFFMQVCMIMGVHASTYGMLCVGLQHGGILAVAIFVSTTSLCPDKLNHNPRPQSRPLCVFGATGGDRDRARK